jgi:hypothetical protein
MDFTAIIKKAVELYIDEMGLPEELTSDDTIIAHFEELNMGYMNKILRINLTKNAITEEKLDEKIAKNFVGGRGLGAKIISDEVDPETDALSENNKLVFLAGPLTGTKAPTSGRFCASFKSPLTGTIADSQAGEKLSLISSVIVNGHRALGRAGIGAVMGSKNSNLLNSRPTGLLEQIVIIRISGRSPKLESCAMIMG